MLYQVFLPYWLSADFMIRLQWEMLWQWLDQWSVVTAARGGGREQCDETVGVQGRPRDADSPQITPVTTAEKGLVTTKDDDEASILHRAYLKWLSEGCPDGQHLRHYFEAARELQG